VVFYQYDFDAGDCQSQTNISNSYSLEYIVILMHLIDEVCNKTLLHIVNGVNTILILKVEYDPPSTAIFEFAA
jgi:hypothetical protein